MSDAAQRVKAAAPGQGYQTAAGLLELPSDATAKTIYVIHDGTNVGFSRTADGVFQTEGISWTFGRDEVHYLFMSFCFLGDVDEIVSSDTALLLSAPATGLVQGTHTQVAAVPPTEHEYAFDVRVDGRTGSYLIDPKIVVTPM